MGKITDELRAAVVGRERIYAVPRPLRHADALERCHDAEGSTVDVRDARQGFVDATGRYYTRRVAWKLAEREGVVGGHWVQLYTEDLW